MLHSNVGEIGKDWDTPILTYFKDENCTKFIHFLQLRISCEVFISSACFSFVMGEKCLLYMNIKHLKPCLNISNMCF